MGETITISEELAETLRDRKGPAESYEDVIRRLVDESESVTGGDRRGVAGRPDPAIETDDEVAKLVNEVAVEAFPDAGATPEERREALRAVVEYLRERETADRSDFERDVYPKHPAGYSGERDPADAWWDEAASAGLAALADRSDVIERVDDGTWRYAGGRGG